ncbi:Transcription elongation factor SPT5 [Grifola frondosa]|uniref:Transcription elongation factor SPT5 n=1 Tax=Grifola frondosa TaxID=5627 RepID=A0A1C7M0R1_GRIFR|nr:Transcription elongation factor SPT5 [Grifola frondosa]
MGRLDPSRFLDVEAEVVDDDDEQSSDEEDKEDSASVGWTCEGNERKSWSYRPRINCEVCPTYTEEYVNLDDIPQQFLLPTSSDPTLWVVHVEMGREEDASYSCQVYLEGSSLRYAQLRAFIPTFYIRRDYSVVEVEERTRLLHVGSDEDFDIKKAQWVRIRKGPYKSDIAFLVDTVGYMAKLNVVPRVVMERALGAHRPPPKLFDPVIVGATYGSSSVIQKDQTYKFKGRTFNKFGLEELIIPITDIQDSRPVITLAEIIGFFEASPKNELNIDIAETARILNQDSLRTLSFGDRVRVTHGEQQGLFGYFHGFEETSALVQVEHNDVVDGMLIPTAQLQRYFKLGDSVKVRSGQYKDRSGMISRLDGLFVYIVERGTDEHVLAANLDFCVPDFALVAQPSSSTSVDGLSRRDPKDPIVGRSVHVSNGPLKGQRGIVKSVRDSTVELEVTSQLIVHGSGTQLVQREDLLLVQGRLRPLSWVLSTEDLDFSMNSTVIPPVRASTPIPEVTATSSTSGTESSALSPAWNPLTSNLEPNPPELSPPGQSISESSIGPMNDHWLFVEILRPTLGKNAIMFTLSGTNGNDRFMDGAYEGQTVRTVPGMPLDPNAGTCLVQLLTKAGTRIHAPVRFLSEMPPLRGDRAMIIAGDRVGDVVNVRQIMDGEAQVAHSNQRKVTKIETRFLVKVSGR